jgi:hypothetical protein
MRLDIVGDPQVGLQGAQNIHINHNPGTKCTSIVCHADIVTVKIAAEVLEEKYQEALKNLAPEMIARIEQTVKEALHYEEYRSKNLESGSNC